MSIQRLSLTAVLDRGPIAIRVYLLPARFLPLVDLSILAGIDIISNAHGCPLFSFHRANTSTVSRFRICDLHPAGGGRVSGTGIANRDFAASRCNPGIGISNNSPSTVSIVSRVDIPDRRSLSCSKIPGS